MSTERTDGPWLTLFDLGGADVASPKIYEKWSNVESLIKEAESRTAGNVSVTVIPLRVVLAAPELLEALGDCTSALQMYDGYVMAPEDPEGWREVEGGQAWRRAKAAIATAVPCEGEE